MASLGIVFFIIIRRVDFRYLLLFFSLCLYLLSDQQIHFIFDDNLLFLFSKFNLFFTFSVTFYLFYYFFLFGIFRLNL